MTYGILQEAVKILYEEMFARERIPFVSYVEGQSEVGTVIENIKPSNWDVAVVSGVATM